MMALSIKNELFKKIFWIIDWLNPYQLSKEIRAEQVHLLYQQQTGFTLLAESIVASVICITLWSVTNHNLLIGWLFYIYIVSGLGRWILIKSYYSNTHISNDTWLVLFIFSVFFTGCGWGFVSIFLMPTEDVFYQMFIILILFGITAVANNLNAPVLAFCILFLILAFVPLSIWFFLQGGFYSLFGVMSFFYIGVMISTAYYTNKFLLKSLVSAQALTNSLELTTSILDATNDGIMVVNLYKHIEYYNQKFLDMWKLSAEFLETHTNQEVIKKVSEQIENPEQFEKKIEYLFQNPYQEGFDILKFKDGRVYERYSKSRIIGLEILGRVWSFHDITERKKMEEEILYQAAHDTLTGLPNRVLLTKRLHQMIKYAKRFGNNLAILFIDIDNFKTINDNLGHNAGDVLLRKVSDKLVFCMREIDTVFRFGGDEFVILCILQKQEDINHIVQRIYNNLINPIKINKLDIIITVSMGISLYPQHGKDSSTLLKNADIAMYWSKNHGKNYHEIYTKELSQNLERRMTIQNQLHYAIENKEFFLVYQPIIDLKSEQIASFEALLRWQHPEMGLIFPDEFIPIAEESGLIIQLGEWVIREACIQAKIWQSKVLGSVQVAINVSCIQINKKTFVKSVEQILKETQFDPHSLYIEITESTLMLNNKHIVNTLEQLRKMGVKISIDDFGTGYSSFSYLKNFPIDKLKIDKSFIDDCTTINGRSIIKAMIAMGHHLNLLVLAEGVETLEQLRLLKNLGCDEIQGYLYSPPMFSEEITKIPNSCISSLK